MLTAQQVKRLERLLEEAKGDPHLERMLQGIVDEKLKK